ncbi:MAG: TIGR02206 family membrane protein [Eubacteriales bacterium]
MKNKKIFSALLCAYIGIMILFCVIGTIPTGNNTWEQGATVYYPYNNTVFPHGSFHILGSVYSKGEVDSMEIHIEPGNDIIPITREKIYYRDEEILTLSTFDIPVKLDFDEYEATIVINDAMGEHEYDSVNFSVVKMALFSGTGSFQMFSAQHILALAAVIIAYLIILMYFRKKPNEKRKKTIYLFIAACIVLCDFAVKLWLLKNQAFKVSYDAFLHMCDISGPLLIILFFMEESQRRQKLFSLMIIWGLLGASMALLTPEMRGNVFPSLYFMTFFIKHGAIVIGVLIVGVMEKYSPKFKHLPIVLAVSGIIVAIIYGINQLIVFLPPFEAGNYMFLSYPPTGGSAIDILVQIFGPSPYYIIGMGVLAVVLYTFVWAIYWMAGKMKKKSK